MDLSNLVPYTYVSGETNPTCSTIQGNQSTKYYFNKPRKQCTNQCRNSSKKAQKFFNVQTPDRCKKSLTRYLYMICERKVTLQKKSINNIEYEVISTLLILRKSEQPNIEDDLSNFFN